MEKIQKKFTDIQTTSGFQKTEIKIDTFKNEIQQNCPDDGKMFFSLSEKNLLQIVKKSIINLIFLFKGIINL